MLKPKGYWTKERCAEEALKYSTRSYFMNGSPSAYDKALRKGWVDDICGHMVPGKKPSGYWTKENCAEEALKYTVRKDFHKGSSGCYTIASRNGWLDDICGHMEVVGHRYRRYVYEIVDHDEKVVYIGLTFHPKRRLSAHKSSSKRIIEKFIDPVMNVLTDLLPIQEASRVEGEKLSEYYRKGYEILNRAKTGGLGANHKMWTKETIAQEALKYTNRSDFSKGSSGAYTIACRTGWLDEVCAHIVDKKAKSGQWSDKAAVIAEARKYDSLKEFRENANGCFTICHKRGWADEACAHMDIRAKLPNGYWHEKENCRQEALKYAGRGEFAKGCIGAYNVSRKNGWLDEFFPRIKEG